MNGHIIPGTPIAVDFWKKRECPSAKFFFLTHLHGDHTVGLSSSWQYNIYCSEITSKLLINKYHIRDDLVIVLETGSSHIIYLDEEKQEQMVVSVIDANHCPGSVMFLFEGYFGKVLYTGDFRYSNTMFSDTPPSKCSNIDILYLDNTYCAPQCIFPTREEATENILSLIQQHNDHRVLIGMRNLGKEDLLVEIAEKTHEWISVSSSMYQTAEIMGLPNVFCIDDMDCRIRVVPVHSITRSNVLSWNDYEPTIAIVPSALYTGLDCSPYSDCPNIHVIPYSDHSNFEEICTFVDKLKPKFIQPIVNERPRGGIFGKLAERSDMSCLNEYLSTGSTVKCNIPPTVKKFMSIPMTSYIKKVSKNKKQSVRKLRVKKKAQATLGVVFDSPRKSQEDISAQEFERQLENMQNSFKPVQRHKERHGTNSSVVNDQKGDQVTGSSEQNEKKLSVDVKTQDASDVVLSKGGGTVQVNHDPNTNSPRGNDSSSSKPSDFSCDDDIESYSSESESDETTNKRVQQTTCYAGSNVQSHNVQMEIRYSDQHKLDKAINNRRSRSNSLNQTKIDSWFHSALTNPTMMPQKNNSQIRKKDFHNKDANGVKETRNEVFSVSCKKSIDTHEQIKAIPLKPMHMKRNISSEFNVFPIKGVRSKRFSSDDLVIQPVKKTKAVE